MKSKQLSDSLPIRCANCGNAIGDRRRKRFCCAHCGDMAWLKEHPAEGIRIMFMTPEDDA